MNKNNFINECINSLIYEDILNGTSTPNISTSISTSDNEDVGRATTKKVVEDGIEYTVETDKHRKVWKLNGVIHRENGPAIEHSLGDLSWYENGKLHREDGPAIECLNGDKFWYRNGKLHREDGPAVERGHGAQSWFLDGGRYTEEEFKAEMRGRKLNSFSEDIDDEDYYDYTDDEDEDRSLSRPFAYKKPQM